VKLDEAAQRLWLTPALMLAIFLAAVATGSVTGKLSEDWMQRLGARPADLWTWHWERLVTSLFFTWGGWTLAAVLAMAAVMVGPAEWELGWRRALAAFVSTAVGALLLSAAAGGWVMAALGRSAEVFYQTPDVGPSAGCYGCLAMVLAARPGRWRRALAVIVAGIIAGVFVGRGLSAAVEPRVTGSDFEHVLAYGLGWLVGLRLRRKGRSQPVSL